MLAYCVILYLTFLLVSSIMADDHKHHHGHRHGHHHADQDGEAFTEVNRKHWNEFASKYTSEQWQKDMLNKINAFIYQNINWIGVDFIDPSTTFEKPSSDTARQVRVLDYACGPGTITHALGGRASEYIGIDLSENMVKSYNLRFNPEANASQRLSDGIFDLNDEKLAAHAVVGNLIDLKEPSPADLSRPDYFNFDLVVVGLGFHHFQNIPLATARLVERLKPGGVFLILDFVTHAMDEMSKLKSENPDSGDMPTHTVAHAGFSEEELKKYFEDAGLTKFDIVRMDGDVLLKGTVKRRPFLARGVKL